MATSSSLGARILESLTLGRIVASIVTFFLVSFIIDFAQKPRYPKSLPQVGHGDGILGTLKNWRDYISHFNEWVDEGYEKYSKNDRAFVVPCAPSRPKEIVVPRSQTMWMLDQPESKLSTNAAHDEVLYGQYNFLGKDHGKDQYGIHVIHKSLARSLAGIIPYIQDEVIGSIDDAFGFNTEWQEINLWDAWLEVVSRTTNRILVGEPTCQNKEFLGCMVKFADAVVINGLILNLIPKIMQPIAGRLVCIPNWLHWRKAHKILEPVLKKRLDDMARKDAGEAGYEDWEAPVDFMTWSIRLSKTEERWSELDPVEISKSMLPVEFAAIHTTLLTGHNLILDLLSSDPSLGFVESIREETTRVLAEENGHWTKAALTRLYQTDSAIRESQRVSHFATSLIRRKVIHPDGLANPAEGWHAPYGSFLMLNLANVHHDGDLYPDPHTFNAFRFSEPREAFEARPKEERSSDETIRMAKLGMVTSSPEHLAFGHGRHTCPGRFFVAHELKIALAYLLQKYEFKPLAKKPKSRWVGQTIIPPVQAKLQVRRREETG